MDDVLQLSEVQKKILKYLESGRIALPGNGASITVNAKRVCNIDTMMALSRLGLVQKDAQGCWSATSCGKTVAKQLTP